MAFYTRLGSYLLASELTVDPLGKIHRGLTLKGGAFDCHYLIRSFSDELADTGMAKLADAQRVSDLISSTRGFGTNYRFETGKNPYVICDYVPGRSLAQVLAKTREEQIPLGVDHALSVLQGIAQSVIQMHGKGVAHGVLSTHSVWVSFEGATQILDAPYAAVLQGLLPKAPHLEAQLAPYHSKAASTPLQQDLFALGAMLYEILTLEKLPAANAIPAALATATLKAAQEDGPIPAEVVGLLKTLLLLDAPFATAAAFTAELEKVLYDGDYSPTTFNMAFFMHTLFREEADADLQAMKADQGADFSPFLSTHSNAGSLLEDSSNGGRNSNLLKYSIIGGGIMALLFGGLLISNRANSQKNLDLQQKIVALQQENAANDAKLVDLNKAQEVQKALEDRLAKEANEAKTQEERTKAKHDLEEAKRLSDDLIRQRKDIIEQRQKLSIRAQLISSQVKAQPQQTAPAPAAVVPTIEPALPLPRTQPAPPTVAPIARDREPVDVIETPPSVTRKVFPVAPRIANKAVLPPALRDSEIKVSLKVFVHAQGKGGKVVIINGVDGPFGYNEAAKAAAEASDYAPAQRGSKPTSGWLNMEYNFGHPQYNFGHPHL